MTHCSKAPDSTHFDFIVIGGGSGGYAAARTARETCERVAIVDAALWHLPSGARHIGALAGKHPAIGMGQHHADARAIGQARDFPGGHGVSCPVGRAR